MTRPEHITWQIREVLQTLLRGDLVVPKNDGEGKKVRSLLVAMWLDGFGELDRRVWRFGVSDHW